MTITKDFSIDRSKYDDHNPNAKNRFVARPGLHEDVIRKISQDKNEPEWMLAKRLKALKLCLDTPMPKWGPSLEKLNLDELTYYVDPDTQIANTWDDVPQDIKDTFEKLGIPQAEREALAGVGGQYDSAGIYHNLKKELKEQGVIFEDMDVALKKYPDMVKKYFMTSCVPITDHKFASLHAAVWSGGSFIYVPPGVKIDLPMQAYFRMNQQGSGQFEHTLIIADKGSEIHYLEGCSSPKFSKNSLHAGCVEVHVLEGAKVKYSSVENWSKNTFNLNTKRAIVHKDASIEWLNGQTGSGVTMLYPAAILMGDNSHCESLGIAFAGEGQNQDTGTKVIHIGKNTSSTLTSKSISKDGGISSYRGLVKIAKSAQNAKVSVECDALMIDNKSESNTYPQMEVFNESAQIAHEATVGKIGEKEINYLMARGLSEEQAKQMIVSGFINPVIKQLPLEYAVELNKLIELEMEGSLG
ncbi:MAG: Fe-S cluster assembly protein SufB [Nanoarchaeota archaeon]|nr:Fe-S cluster assembly protein SufB [Nanoarchaeota archaeon]